MSLPDVSHELLITHAYVPSIITMSARSRVDYEERLDVYLKFSSPKRTAQLTISSMRAPIFSFTNTDTAADRAYMKLRLGTAMLKKLKLASNPYTPGSFDVGTKTGPSHFFVQMSILQLARALDIVVPRVSDTLFDQIQTLLRAIERQRLATPPSL